MRRSSVLSVVLIPLTLVVACGGTMVKIGENDMKLQKNPDGSSTGNGQTCTYGGTTVNVGQSFPSPDGCNQCTCAADGAYCTERACAGDAGLCIYDGKTYKPGDSFPSTDGCNSCGCSADGLVACTKKACALDCSATASCKGPRPGAPNIQCADGTVGGPVCADIGGACGWTMRSCECKDANGGVHKAGETWDDGCNSCSCDQQGYAMCTARACACPPDQVVNCMPPSSSTLCSGPYHQWVVANCPGVKFVY
jgi:hypothetical protein